MGVTVLYGGTFNPLHIGHFETLKVLDGLPEISRILLIPDRIPPHKEPSFTVPDAVRIEMCRLAAKEFSKVRVSLLEFERPGKSYTVDTVKTLRQQYPEESLWFACGGDMLATLDSWYHADELIRLCGFYSIERKGFDGFSPAVARLRQKGAQIRVIEADIPEVSSTMARKCLRKGDYGDFLPETVRDYLTKNKAYEEKKVK